MKDIIFSPGTGEGPTVRLPGCHVDRDDQEEIQLGHEEAEQCPLHCHAVAPVLGPTHCFGSGGPPSWLSHNHTAR